VAAGLAWGFEEGMELATRSVEGGAALSVLEKAVEMSRELAAS
jgi:anthranilate phosphoribosyltransferase